MNDDDHRPEDRARVVQPFYLPPVRADPALIIVNGDEQLTAVGDQIGGVVQRPPHGAGVMEYTPGVADVEPTEARQVIGELSG